MNGSRWALVVLSGVVFVGLLVHYARHGRRSHPDRARDYSRRRCRGCISGTTKETGRGRGRCVHDTKIGVGNGSTPNHG